MNSLFQLISKRLPVFTVLLGLFIFFYPIVEVNASGIGPTFTGDKKTITPESPNELNFLSIKSAEENKATGTNCGVSTISGLFASVFNSVEKISSVRFKDFAEAKYCGDSDSVKKFVTGQVNSSGILGLLNKVNGSVMEQRPASGIQYAEEKVYAITNPGVVYAAEPSSYFPGTGFDLLQPVRSFWGWSVNLVFGFLIIIILLVAFAIIFRQKLSGSAEVTIQNAIPNIALAMILVPLSYAISGLFIDGITIGSNAVHDFLVGPASPGNQVFTSRESTDIQNGSERDRGLYIDDERVNWINARSQADYRQEIEQISEGVGVNAGPLSVISTLLNILDEDEINKGSDNPGATSAWLGTIINAILSIFMIWIGIKVFIALFKKYITILLMPIFSPFIFATVAVPGNGTKAIVNYAKLMGSASLGFIVAYAMFLLTIIFSNSAFQSTIPDFNTGLWVPPLLGLQSNGVLGIDQTGLSGAGAGIGIVPFLLGLVSLGIYFSIPSVLNQIDAALGEIGRAHV